MDLNIKTNDKDHLDIGGADALDLVEEFGSPIYAIDEVRIRENYNKFYNSFSKYYPDFKVFYACKYLRENPPTDPRLLKAVSGFVCFFRRVFLLLCNTHSCKIMQVRLRRQSFLKI